ncbi:MAG TPA: Fe-S cluster assembly protein SufD [Chitinophagaceae bacterium]|jgi:Fe-S cluster assembly protein SufD|nr:Fe-S cluster assembly protein SufD [Chitinophagaceae bacterium]
MNTFAYFKERFEQLQPQEDQGGLDKLREHAFQAFSQMGIPGSKHEEWKYTRVAGLFNREFQLPADPLTGSISAEDLKRLRLPGHEQASEMVFVNGFYSFALSRIRSSGLQVLALEEAAKNGFRETVSKWLGDSGQYQKDGINALNTAFVHGAVFIHVDKEQHVEHPIYIYHITDARSVNILSQPRSLMFVNEGARLQVVENYATLGNNESFTNQVMEIIVDHEARLEYYKIQNDGPHTNQVSTTHIRQIGGCFTHTVTISLNGGLVRNNLNVVLDAKNCEAHLYGLYFQSGRSHIDNHTIVDNIKPNCLSNELYKGILNEQATGVFNGKIFVRQPAQKTNAYQSNKNILLSDSCSVNTKPQLEIFADDVKCTHGCTVGRLNEEGLFYLQSRGISEKTARNLLLSAYASDILEQIKPEPLRRYVEKLIHHRLEKDLS